MTSTLREVVLGLLVGLALGLPPLIGYSIAVWQATHPLRPPNFYHSPVVKQPYHADEIDLPPNAATQSAKQGGKEKPR